MSELDEIRAILRDVAIQQQTNTQAIEHLTADIEQTNNTVEILVGAINGVLARMDAAQADIREMQSEVRGIQTENRRILERLEHHTHE